MDGFRSSNNNGNRLWDLSISKVSGNPNAGQSTTITSEVHTTRTAEELTFINFTSTVVALSPLFCGCQDNGPEPYIEGTLLAVRRVGSTPVKQD